MYLNSLEVGELNFLEGEHKRRRVLEGDDAVERRIDLRGECEYENIHMKHDVGKVTIWSSAGTLIIHREHLGETHARDMEASLILLRGGINTPDVYFTKKTALLENH